MKKIIFSIVILILIISSVLALSKLSDFVNDEAGVISPQYTFLIEEELYELKANTSVEMAVATIITLNGTPIEEYSLNLAHNVLGEKGKDNGVLILLAVNDSEYRIEVGYGLEPVLNAALLGRIGRNIMEPEFKDGNYEEGLLEGVRAIDSILRNDTSYETRINGSKDIRTTAINFIITIILKFAPLVIFLIIFVLVMIVISRDEKKKKKGKKKKDDSDDFLAALIIANMFGRGGSGGSGGFGGSSGGGGFGGFGGGSFGGGGFSGKF
ncbi:TPM domain-containing protein [Candidatus Woesearchaeota archaeon]|nr:TPM domain-containing protein [Candidatus Woesearchaeota archaeon]